MLGRLGGVRLSSVTAFSHVSVCRPVSSVSVPALWSSWRAHTDTHHTQCRASLLSVCLSPTTSTTSTTPGPLFSSHSRCFSSSTAAAAALPEDTDAFLSVQVVESGDSHTLVVRTPLPTITGVMTAEFGTDSQLSDLFAAIQSRSDAPIAELDVRDGSGRLYAASTRLGHVIDKPFLLNADGFRISALSTVTLPEFGGTGVVHAADEHPGYATVKAELLDCTDASTTADELRAKLRSAALGEGTSASDLDDLTDGWWRQLHQEGLILCFDASPDPSMRQVVFVKPYLLHDKLQKALDIRGSAVRQAIDDAEKELNAAVALHNEMTTFKQDIVRRARSRVKVAAYSFGVFLIVQWGVIFHFVYEQSWDVMEPLCYFLSAFSGCLLYTFFMRTRRDPSAGNVFSWLLQSSQQTLHSKLGRDSVWQSAKRFAEEKNRTKSQIKELRERLVGLREKLPRES